MHGIALLVGAMVQTDSTEKYTDACVALIPKKALLQYESARHCPSGNGTDGQYTWESALGKVHLGKYTYGKVHLGRYTQEGTPKKVHRCLR